MVEIVKRYTPQNRIDTLLSGIVFDFTYAERDSGGIYWGIGRDLLGLRLLSFEWKPEVFQEVFVASSEYDILQFTLSRRVGDILGLHRS